MVHVIYDMLHVTKSTLHVISHLFFPHSCQIIKLNETIVLGKICLWLFTLTCDIWHVTCHRLYVTCHMSCFTCHMSHVTCDFFFLLLFFFLIFLKGNHKEKIKKKCWHIPSLPWHPRTVYFRFFYGHIVEIAKMWYHFWIYSSGNKIRKQNWMHFARSAFKIHA